MNGESKSFCGFAGCNGGYCVQAPRLGHKYYSGSNILDITFQSDFSNEDINPVGFRMYYVKTGKLIHIFLLNQNEMKNCFTCGVLKVR